MDEEIIEKEELKVWQPYIEDHFVDILNGEKPVEVAREDLLSFRNTKHYTGTKTKFLEN